MRIVLGVLGTWLLLAGCSGDDVDLGIGDASGVGKRDITRTGEERCAFHDEFVDAAQAAFDEPVGDYPGDFDPVILHVGDQDYADSADSTDLFDVRGAYTICRYSIGDIPVEGFLYYFGPTDERTRLEDAYAWEYAYDDVDNGITSMPVDEADRRTAAFRTRMRAAELGEPVPVEVDGYRSVVVAIPARGGDGASAALGLRFEEELASEDEATELARLIAADLAER